LVGRRHANEENATAIRNQHRGGAECRGGGNDTSSVPEALYASREDTTAADTPGSARIVLSYMNDSRVDSSNAMRAAHAVAPNLAYPPQWRLPTTDVKPLASSKCRRRHHDAPPCRRHARGGGRLPVLLPQRARNRLWSGPTATKHFRVGRYMANRRSINSKPLPQWVYCDARRPEIAFFSSARSVIVNHFVAFERAVQRLPTYAQIRLKFAAKTESIAGAAKSESNAGIIGTRRKHHLSD